MTINRSRILTTALIWAVFLGWQCKEKTAETPIEKVEVAATKPTPKIIVDLVEFAGLNLTDTTNIKELLNIKEIDSNGLVKDLETDRAARAFKQKMTTKESTRLPFLEIQNSDEIVVVFQGKGYGGPIWALVLINTQKQTIEKLSLDHSAESDGYGAAMTYSSFENQFVDRDLSLDEYNFGLKQNDKMLIEGIHEIDGLAGATETGNAVIEMINNGIKSYEIYLKQHKE